jgi:hypothetical protein
MVVFTDCYYGDQIEQKMVGVCITYGGSQRFLSENLTEKRIIKGLQLTCQDNINMEK